MVLEKMFMSLNSLFKTRGSNLKTNFKKNICQALIGVAQLVEHYPAKQKVTSLIPGQGMYLGCTFGPQSVHVREATDRCFSHPCFFPSLSPFLQN